MDQANILRDRLKQKDTIDSNNLINQNSRIISITSGKGGVGKTNFAVNLAINLAKKGKRVVLIDADFGLANVEVLFGITPRYSLAHVFLGDKEIEEVIAEGPMGIKFISGGSGFRELANITENQMRYIIRNLKYLDRFFDFIIIDTGAGISNTVINFIRIASEIFIVMTAEPTSLTDAEAIVRSVMKLKKTDTDFGIIINRVEDTHEGDETFEKILNASKDVKGANLNLLGYIPEDRLLVKAVKQQKPVSICYPESSSSEAIYKISKRVVDTDYKSEGVVSCVMRLVGRIQKLGE